MSLIWGYYKIVGRYRNKIILQLSVHTSSLSDADQYETCHEQNFFSIAHLLHTRRARTHEVFYIPFNFDKLDL